MKKNSIDDSLSANINIKWFIQIIIAVGVGVWAYAELTERLNILERESAMEKMEIKLNSEFRVKWPRGQLGALPDDAEQNIRLAYLEKEVEKLEEKIEELKQ